MQGLLARHRETVSAPTWLAELKNDVGFGSWLCENHSAARSRARLIRIECPSRMKQSPKS
jgi:hypothetical protein